MICECTVMTRTAKGISPGLDESRPMSSDTLTLRLELMRRLGEIIVERGLTQTQAAGLMYMDQPRVSALIKGKVQKFSTDRLLKALSDLGQDVEIRITPARTKRGLFRVAPASGA